MGFDISAILKNPAVIATALAGVGGALGNRAGKQSQKSSQQTNLTPDQQALMARLVTSQTALSADPDLSGYEAGQVSDINRMHQFQMQSLQDNLALRGVTGPAAAAAEAGQESGRFADITKLHQSIPLLRNQINTSNLNTGISLFGSMPRNVSTTSEGTANGNVAGGGLSNAASTLAYFLGQGAFKKPAAPITPSSSASKPFTFNPGVFMPANYGRINRTPNYVG